MDTLTKQKKTKETKETKKERRKERNNSELSLNLVFVLKIILVICNCFGPFCHKVCNEIEMLEKNKGLKSFGAFILLISVCIQCCSTEIIQRN